MRMDPIAKEHNTMRAGTTGLLVAGSAILVLASAGCGSDSKDTADSGASPSVTGTTTASPTASTSPSTPSASSPASAGGTACPVTADVLVPILERKTGKLDSSTTIKNVSCYEGYASITMVSTVSDPGSAVFRYDAAAKSWVFIDNGSAIDCTGKVPAAIIPHLPGCGER